MLNEQERIHLYTLARQVPSAGIDWELHAKGMLARFRSTTVKYLD